MTAVLLIWIYIALTTIPIASVFLSYLYGKDRSFLRTEDVAAFGILIATVYAQLFSLFGRLSLAANILLIIISLVCAFIMIRKKIAIPAGKPGPLQISLVVIAAIILSYCSSRGYMHIDSDLYHAQSVHWLESFGTVKGLGNVHIRLGYNSSSFALTALYALSFINGQSYHVCAGYMALIVACSALRIGHIFFDRKVRISDFARIAGLYYIFDICDEIVSPASDYFTMLAYVYVIIKCIDLFEIKADLGKYSFPALFSILAVTFKLSAAPLVLMCIPPFVGYIKKKERKPLITCIITALVMTVPYFIRGFLLSGWFFYPSRALGFIKVPWRIPEGLAIIDSKYIIAYGRGSDLYQAADLKLTEWFPGWLSGIGRTDRIFFILSMAGIFIWLCLALQKKYRNMLLYTQFVAIMAFAVWFLSSPLIRYGRSFIIMLPCIMFGTVYGILSTKKLFRRSAPVLLASFTGAFLIYKMYFLLGFVILFSDNPNYITQQDYGTYDTYLYEVDGHGFYASNDMDLTGYDPFPSAGGYNDEFEMLGDSYADGFKPAEELEKRFTPEN